VSVERQGQEAVESTCSSIRAGERVTERGRDDGLAPVDQAEVALGQPELVRRGRKPTGTARQALVASATIAPMPLTADRLK